MEAQSSKVVILVSKATATSASLDPGPYTLPIEDIAPYNILLI